ncbi:DUF2863 family protein [Herbaspirillum sp. RTI4]|uniref:DUF2863 family protein n=1 Tax=Herbaspirillum sp. RTI4 TaxID=3048640 RepID=UPI002AB56E94|nr:DUF2863 family protein [Herbaspirillum sp. RTI4]MDY7578581.1 DUF2863 family protein [Herbaspirillum sp. RTI4]MEA9981113.1 DUF2863 family protein [Herbaspirillum sp. RTI4]
MRRPVKQSTQKFSADSQRLTALSQALEQASSRIEQRGWELQLDALATKVLGAKQQNTLDAALEHLFNSDIQAYDVLVEAIENASESCIIDDQGMLCNALLIAFPVLAWTRFSIASGNLPADVQANLFAQLHGHILAAGARIALSPTLYAIDQLPRDHVEVHALTRRMAQAALTEGLPKAASKPLPTAPFMADTRYLLACVVAPCGAPLLRWQEAAPVDIAASKADVLTQWSQQAGPSLSQILPGCNLEFLFPAAYFSACREADKKIRKASIHAANHYLIHNLNVDSKDLHANIGGFSEDGPEGRVDEYRIGFSVGGGDIVYGVVWPLYGQEDAEAEPSPMTPGGMPTEPTPLEEILGALRENGIVHVRQHAGCFEMEVCEDCGAPFFPDEEGILVHAEMPEDMPVVPGHLH